MQNFCREAIEVLLVAGLHDMANRICHGGILKPFCRLREALPKQNLIKLAYIGQRGFDHVGIH